MTTASIHRPQCQPVAKLREEADEPVFLSLRPLERARDERRRISIRFLSKSTSSHFSPAASDGLKPP